MRFSPFIILCGIGLFAIFSSTISKNPSLPLLVSDLGGDQAAIGIIAGISAFTGILVSLPAGLLSDRIGRHKMLMASGFVFASAPFFYILASGIWQLGVIRFYHGFATAVFGPVAMAYVADLHQESRGEKMGWFSTATLLGRFMAPAAGGVILSHGAVQGNLNFNLLYIVCGIAGLLSLAGIFLLPGKDKTKDEKTSSENSLTIKEGLIRLISNRLILATCAVEAAVLFSYGIFETFLPVRCVGLGIRPWEIGLCISSQVITIAVSKPVLGSYSDKHGRSPQIIAGALCGAVCMLLLTFSKVFWHFMVVSVFTGLSISIVTSASAAYIADLSDKKAYGSAMGALGSLMDTGHTTGPVIAGVLAVSFGLTASFICGSVVLVLGCINFIFFSKFNLKA